MAAASTNHLYYSDNRIALCEHIRIVRLSNFSCKSRLLWHSVLRRLRHRYSVSQQAQDEKARHFLTFTWQCMRISEKRSDIHLFGLSYIRNYLEQASPEVSGINRGQKEQSWIGNHDIDYWNYLSHNSPDFLCRIPGFCAEGTFCAKPERRYWYFRFFLRQSIRKLTETLHLCHGGILLRLQRTNPGR